MKLKTLASAALRLRISRVKPIANAPQASLINRFSPSLRIPVTPNNWAYLRALRQAEYAAWTDASPVQATLSGSRA